MNLVMFNYKLNLRLVDIIPQYITKLLLNDMNINGCAYIANYYKSLFFLTGSVNQHTLRTQTCIEKSGYDATPAILFYEKQCKLRKDMALLS